jgi:hypothetical protein
MGARMRIIKITAMGAVMMLCCGLAFGRGILTIAIITQASAQEVVPLEVIKSIDDNVALMNKQAPIEINPLQKMTHVSRNGEVILYSIETALPEEQWTQEMRDRPRRETTKVMCTGENTRLLLDYGFQMRYLISDASGHYVTSFFVSKDKCLAAQN